MDWIAARFKDCLCPTCLQLVADGVLGPEVPPSETHGA